MWSDKVMGSKIEIRYIYHSGFTVETDQHVMVFDYYKGRIDWSSIPEKKIYVFASHTHPDHFNREIFAWKAQRPGIRYILSSDIAELPVPVAEVNYIAPYQELEVDDLKIKAFNSTKVGMTFFMQYEAVKIVHARDLNWWYWWGETPEEIANAEKLFKTEMAKIQGVQIDIAFFPVDPRLEHNYSLGAEYFIEAVRPRYLIPMHFWEDYSAIQRFAAKMKDSPSQVVNITHQGQVFTIDL